MGGGRPGATRWTASPSELGAVIVGHRGRHIAGVRPAGDTTCRDGCYGVDDQREPRSGLFFLAGLGIKPISKLGRLNHTPSTRRDSGRQPRTVMSICCHVPKPQTQTQTRHPRNHGLAPRETSRDRPPLNHGSCGRITPVTAGNDLAPFLPLCSTGGEGKEAKSVTGRGCH